MYNSQENGEVPMTGSKTSREVLAMETNHPDHVISFGKKTGCYVSRAVAALLGVFFVSGIVATGLLVYYYAPLIRDGQQQPFILDKPLTTAKPMLTIAKKPIAPLMQSSTTSTTPATTTTTTTTVATTTNIPTTTTGATVEKEKLDVRLPRALKPLHYLVKLQPYINGNFSITGYVEVEMEVLESTSNITLHISDIITHNDTIKLRPSGNLESPLLGINKHEYDHEREFYVAHLNEPLEQGQKYILSMHFLGYLNDQLEGFYRSTYKDDDGTDKLLAATQFQATDARKAFPCFDEPGLKATFEVYLAREKNMTSISNMPIIETIPVDGQDNWVWDHYDTSVPMSTYLVAFVVSDFVNLASTTSNNNTLFRVWARESAIEQAEYSRQVGPAILTHFEEYFSVPYPLPKQDMIAIPDFSAGAMENWGLITYRETAMLYDPKVSAASNKQYVVSVIAHELAHQWFGNIVTPKWWTDLWLNEGFASYVEYIGIDHVEPTWKVMEQLVIKEVQAVFGLDSMESSHPISIPVQHPDEISQIFDRISYAKGASIIRMMNHFLTEGSFRRGLANYLDSFKFDNAEQDDLWHYLTMAAHEDGTLPKDLTVKTIMDTWTLQMGYPVIKVERNVEGTSASVTQERFLVVKNENSTDDHDYKWWVPLNYATSESPQFNHTQAMVWMKNSESEISISSLPPSDQWVIFNIQETGYYRVNYDDNNWNLLIQQLQTDHRVIHSINRAQIIDDAMNLAKAGQLSYDTALGLYGYLGKEQDYVPWSAAINNLGYLKSMFSRAGGYGALKRYLLDILVPLYESVGFQDSPSDPLLEQYKRQKALAWTCALGHKDCLDNVVALYRQWMQNPANDSIISPNLKSTVYCRAIAEGGEEEWNFAWAQYLKSNVGSEKARLLSAMGCTNEIWILSRYLEMSFASESGIRKQDATRVFGAVAGNIVGRPLAWNFLQDKWDMIYEFYGKAKPALIKYATTSFNTAQLLKEVELFQEEHASELGSATRAVEQVIERTKINIAWMNTNYDVIVQWLDQNGYSTKLSNF
ncbi:aminopeptidase N-like isoform X1 [Palaemon carinicauda]|uniref:aminopeptidase N-like isoform X1 n=2 Tax=Palaemon carinicauda TaxID=392227 RepID=UPI0035B5CA17